ncbi:hypothetical protein GCM10023201_30060 [Actinomycetospora corticicola]|uniref:LPXTG-motif cell wall-anchored protein n=1 Tax=Actinomycetospora corticicola TaxID=663602 RepID=A0A7Y9J5B1_9PSEU|nr:hypothetical protein [Actinomycetospora corticicola]NYD35529.1 hypothetical protein [Actinomycetospora corticicola]
MKKTMMAAGAVVALMVMPGVSSASTFSAAPALAYQAANCETDSDGGAKPIDEDTGEEVGGGGDDTGSEDGGDTGSSDEDSDEGADDGAEDGAEDGNGGDDETGDADGDGTGDADDPDADTGEAGGGIPSSPESFSAGRSSLPAQQDCSGALNPGSGYSDEDGDGEPEKVDGIDDDGDGRVDEIDKKAQVSVVPDGGAETGDGSTGDAVGMTLGGGAVLALLGGLAVWIRRATSRL